jgi:CRP-like cAMP-binding protein
LGLIDARDGQAAAHKATLQWLGHSRLAAKAGHPVDTIATRNSILAALPPADFALLQAHLEPVELKFRQRLQASNRRITHAYFPERGIASVVAISRTERRQAEVAIVGREGMTGVPVVLRADRSPCEVFMQVEGKGQRIAADDLRAALHKSPGLLDCLLRYAHAFQMQAHYTALANAQGTIEERLARWLLMAQDRIGGDKLLLTHEFLALMLGTRRAGVTTAMGHFERNGVVETARGAVTILDREGLEECAAGLYGIPEAEFERLFRS